MVQISESRIETKNNVMKACHPKDQAWRHSLASLQKVACDRKKATRCKPPIPDIVKQNLRITVVVALLLTMLTGCLTDTPEFRIDSIRIVSLAEKPDALPWLSDGKHIDKAKILLLEISLSSETDLVQLARPSRIHIGYSAYRCNVANAPDVEVYSPAYLFAGNASLGDIAYFPQPDLSHLRDQSGRISYQAFVPLDGTELRAVYSAKAQKSLYAPRDLSADLCIVVRGGRMWAGRQFSQKIVIPRDTVREVLESRPDMP